jgi:sulfite reductase (NADPH) hemoprotein beta-component
MYRYDDIDRQAVDERVAQFRDQVRRRLKGELNEDEFRPLRLMNGLYLQLHAYMLRIAVPYGMLSSDQMRLLAHIAVKYDKGYGHFTTRQNIQFNWIKLEQAPDLLAELAAAEMHAIQTSGNCIRNVTADQYAGAAADEIEDPRIWAEIIRQWSTFHPEFSFLPRKFKVAVSGAPSDRAAIRVHDIGLQMLRDDAGEVGFQVVVGGGQGRTPYIAETIRDFLPKRYLLSYLEAILRVYNQLGRRDNIYKARIKILVQSVGAARFKEMVEAEWQHLKDGVVDLPDDEVARIHAHFAPPAYDKPGPRAVGTGANGANGANGSANAAFDDWMLTNVVAHKQPAYAIANISLKPTGGVPGDATAAEMNIVADLADRCSFGEIRVTHEQNLVLAHVRRGDLYALWRALDEAGLATANIGLVSDIIACPGLDYCNLATARSIPVAQEISKRFADIKRQQDIGGLTLNISGCINACGHHHVGNIGLLGLEKNGEEFYQITLGGAADGSAAIGGILGPGFSGTEVVDAVETIVDTYLAVRRDDEKFIDTHRRVGNAPFKEKLYATH